MKNHHKTNKNYDFNRFSLTCRGDYLGKNCLIWRSKISTIYVNNIIWYQEQFPHKRVLNSIKTPIIYI